MEFEVGRRMEHIFWSSCSGGILELIFWNLEFSGTWILGLWKLEYGHCRLYIVDYTLETIHWRLVESEIVKAWQGVEVCLWH